MCLICQMRKPGRSLVATPLSMVVPRIDPDWDWYKPEFFCDQHRPPIEDGACKVARR